MKIPIIYTVTGLFFITFLATLLFLRGLVPFLRRKKAGQPILEIGPSWHLSKAGTPTMGGVAFAGAITAAVLLWLIALGANGEIKEIREVSLILGYALLCGAIGLADDCSKLSKKQNQGLSAPQKYFLLLLASALFLYCAMAFCGVDTAIKIPFSRTVLELNGFYYPLALLFLTGTVNALNLTDGVDGLLSSVTAVVAVFFVVWGYDAGEVTVMGAGSLLLGGTLGFFCFNRHPAKIFMGDTGSLFLGGAVSAVGILTEHPLLVLLAGGVFAVEAFSVILQVLWFKLTKGKRLFRMAPLHHHFEKGGWNEWQVVAVFVLFSVILCVLAFAGR